ncbi:peptide MFS transporter [Arenimonas sp.]|uniref:peptide MFS transporter n=1 Tax=Arenimonas sp. TaxID=1872635 RepID=UPI0039E50AF5
MPAADSRDDEFLGHPRGVYVCFFTEMWERFSFYGMKALLLLYLTKYHLFSDTGGLNLLGAYGGLVYCLPVLGGLVADRWLGMRKAVVFGGVLLVLGHLGMAFEGEQARRVGDAVVRDDTALWVFYCSLALIIMGVGFLKPNISVIVGKLYAEDDPRRDSGFSLFYAGINLGAMLASLVCGVLGETYGWKYGFGAAGIGMLAGLAMFLWGQKYLNGAAEPPRPELLRERVMGMPREWAIYLGALLGLAPVAALMWATGSDRFSLDIGVDLTLAQLLMLIVLAVVLSWFARFVLRDCDKRERGQMITLMALIFIALVFYTLYEQTYGSWVVFTDRLLTKDFFPSLVLREGLPLSYFVASTLLLPAAFILSCLWRERSPGSKAPTAIFLLAAAVNLLMIIGMVVLQPQTAGSLTFISGVFILSLAPVFSWLWGWLGRRGRNPGKPFKSVIGLLFGALSFLPLYLAAQAAGDSGTWASVWWLVLAYAVLQVGEICLYPVGLSAVTQLSVARVASLMMGTWFLATAFSELLAAKLGTLASIDDPGAIAEHSAAWASAAATYGDYFLKLTLGGLGCAILAALCLPWLNRGMHGVK